MMMVMVMMKVMMMMVLTRFWRAATPPVREYEDEGTACGGCRHLNKSVGKAVGETSQSAGLKVVGGVFHSTRGS